LPSRGKAGVAGKGTTAKVIKDARETNPVDRTPGAIKSLAKAEDAASVARSNGYDVDIKSAGGFVKVIATKLHDRGTLQETVEVSFIDGRMSQEDMPKVHIALKDGPCRRVLLRNASAFKMQVSGKPSKPVALHARATRVRQEDDPSDDSPEEPRRPFDENATELVLLEAFRGKQIFWRNGLGGGRLESGHISPRAKRGVNYRITDHPKKPGERILHFIDAETRQHRSVSLSKISRVVG